MITVIYYMLSFYDVSLLFVYEKESMVKMFTEKKRCFVYILHDIYEHICKKSMRRT
jgi:hypothetical protein